ncbi:MAG: DUF1194 domain-containing protein [Cyanobacteria bacterium J06638_20]
MFDLDLALFQQARILSGLTTTAALGFVSATALPATAASLIPVDTELSLLVDISNSIDADEYALQTEGYQTAFANLASEFGGGDFGRVAVNLVQWSGVNLQVESVSWTLLDSESSVMQFVDTIPVLPRASISGGTAPGTAIEFATPLFSTNEYDGQRWVMDVSGDGRGTSGVASSIARDNALAAGVDVINGLPIVGQFTDRFFEDWYRNNIQGGEGSFTIAADGFEGIGSALEQKLIAELTLPPTDLPSEVEPPVIDLPVSVPEPTMLWGLGLVFGGLLYRQRRHSV